MRGTPFALVTGASSGIGEALAVELAARGYPLILVSDNPGELQRVAEDVRRGGGVEVRTLVADLAVEGAAEAVWARCADCRGEDRPVEVLVNCAGILLNVERELAAPEAVQRLLTLHVQTTTGLCLRFGQEMIDRGRGYILNVASISALFPDPSSLSYGPSKRYLMALSRTLHLAWREHGVWVCCLVPGGTRTAFFAHNDVCLPGFVARHLYPAPATARRALRALFRGRARIIPGWRARLDILLFRLLLSPPLYGWARRLYFRLRRTELPEVRRSAAQAPGAADPPEPQRR